MRKLLFLSLVGAAFTASTALGATIVTYTSAASFNASTIVGGSPTVTEDFNANSSLFTTFTPIGVPGVPAPGFILGVRAERVTGTYSEQVTLNAGNFVAFGGTWDLTPGSIGSGVKITIALAGGGTQQVTPILGWDVGNYSTPFFFGFTSDVAITSVTLSQGGGGGLSVEGFSLDNMLVEGAVSAGGTSVDPPPGVPEPSTFGLMGLAMVGLGTVRRFRR